MKQVRLHADVIWNYLETSSSKSSTFRELKEALGLSSRSLNQALGWLLHDDQIRMDEESGQVSLTVCPFF